MKEDSPSCLRDVVKGMVKDSLAAILSSFIATHPLPSHPNIPVFVVGSVGDDAGGMHFTSERGDGVPQSYVNLGMVYSTVLTGTNDPSSSDTKRRTSKDLKEKVKHFHPPVVGHGQLAVNTTAHSPLPCPTVVKSDCCHNDKAHSVSQPNVIPTFCAEVHHKIESAFI